jgi:hypothetical protein
MAAISGYLEGAEVARFGGRALEACGFVDDSTGVSFQMKQSSGSLETKSFRSSLTSSPSHPSDGSSGDDSEISEFALSWCLRAAGSVCLCSPQMTTNSGQDRTEVYCTLVQHTYCANLSTRRGRWRVVGCGCSISLLFTSVIGDDCGARGWSFGQNALATAQARGHL